MSNMRRLAFTILALVQLFAIASSQVRGGGDNNVALEKDEEERYLMSEHTRIIGGNQASAGSYSYAVSLQGEQQHRTS